MLGLKDFMLPAKIDVYTFYQLCYLNYLFDHGGILPRHFCTDNILYDDSHELVFNCNASEHLNHHIAFSFHNRAGDATRPCADEIIKLESIDISRAELEGVIDNFNATLDQHRFGLAGEFMTLSLNPADKASTLDYFIQKKMLSGNINTSTVVVYNPAFGSAPLKSIHHFSEPGKRRVAFKPMPSRTVWS